MARWCLIYSSRIVGWLMSSCLIYSSRCLIGPFTSLNYGKSRTFLFSCVYGRQNGKMPKGLWVKVWAKGFSQSQQVGRGGIMCMLQWMTKLFTFLLAIVRRQYKMTIWLMDKATSIYLQRADARSERVYRYPFFFFFFLWDVFAENIIWY